MKGREEKKRKEKSTWIDDVYKDKYKDKSQSKTVYVTRLQTTSF